MRLLLDTHVLLWGMQGGDKLSRRAETAIRSRANSAFVSTVTLWEIAIKVRLGKLTAPENLPVLIDDDPTLELLDIAADHVWRVRELPPIHQDPFDHLLIAQAMVEGMTLVTRDRRMAQYDLPVLLA